MAKNEMRASVGTDFLYFSLTNGRYPDIDCDPD